MRNHHAESINTESVNDDPISAGSIGAGSSATGRPSRRTVLLGVGAIGAVAASAALAGCAGGTGSAAAAPVPTGPIAKTTDIPVGGGKIFTSPQVVVTQPVAGTFKASRRSARTRAARSPRSATA